MTDMAKLMDDWDREDQEAAKAKAIKAMERYPLGTFEPLQDDPAKVEGQDTPPDDMPPPLLMTAIAEERVREICREEMKKWEGRFIHRVRAEQGLGYNR